MKSLLVAFSSKNLICENYSTLHVLSFLQIIMVLLTLGIAVLYFCWFRWLFLKEVDALMPDKRPADQLRIKKPSRICSSGLRKFNILLNVLQFASMFCNVLQYYVYDLHDSNCFKYYESNWSIGLFKKSIYLTNSFFSSRSIQEVNLFKKLVLLSVYGI